VVLEKVVPTLPTEFLVTEKSSPIFLLQLGLDHEVFNGGAQMGARSRTSLSKVHFCRGVQWGLGHQ
jgi:hypothetical protein